MADIEYGCGLIDTALAYLKVGDTESATIRLKQALVALGQEEREEVWKVEWVAFPNGCDIKNAGGGRIASGVHKNIAERIAKLPQLERAAKRLADVVWWSGEVQRQGRDKPTNTDIEMREAAAALSALLKDSPE